MNQTRVAVRYAKALLDQALEKSLIEVVFADMTSLLSICHSNKDFSLFLQSPIIKTEKKVSVLKEIFSSKINALSLDFLLLIVTKKRENAMENIAEEFINQYKKYKKIITAVVTSSVGLDANLRKEVIEIVKKGSASEVELIEKVNPDLIGGFILRIGDKQVDTSILRQLKKLNRTFKENSLQ
ncbi:MAG: ATP synthase F1 subunit delta [Bacteroidia bacterium]